MTPTIKSLTGIRLYAALAVYFSHMYHFNYFGLPQPCVDIISNMGHCGVSIFYVLSGFVLYLNYSEEFSLKTFYIARLARIYPAYLFTLILAIPIELFSPSRNIFFQSLFSGLTLSQCLLPQTCGRLNDVAWSVGVEAWFYILFPLLLIGLNRKILPVLIVLPLLFFIIDPDGFYNTNRFFLNRVPEFCFGILSARYYLSNQSKTLSWFWAVVSILFIFTCALPLKALGWQGYDYLFMLPFSTLLILIISQKELEGFAPKLLTSKVILIGGEISYAFYLIEHIP